ncbi:hypothetical protein LSTR_LSTR010001 [Laodelphax striatellus]|uniref:Uncharacterized protein n=1 Tax=Laodelphax striatellus TaxID=195883 RepID=A0A482WN46_LAOST|nr:hypothetical protein LSTR_LSTR010001 [Laodelphax striatellus]
MRFGNMTSSSQVPVIKITAHCGPDPELIENHVCLPTTASNTHINPYARQESYSAQSRRFLSVDELSCLAQRNALTFQSAVPDRGVSFDKLQVPSVSCA